MRRTALCGSRRPKLTRRDRRFDFSAPTWPSAVPPLLLGEDTEVTLGSPAFSRVAASLLYKTNADELVTYATVPAVIIAARSVTYALSAWRAGRAEQATALRAN